MNKSTQVNLSDEEVASALDGENWLVVLGFIDVFKLLNAL